MKDSLLDNSPISPCRVYFLGIGGAGMYPLARLAKQMGFAVSGCDRAESKNVARLRAIGIQADREERVSCLPTVDLLVYTLATDGSHPLRRQATERGLTVLSRTEFLGRLMRAFPVRATVAGTHGKSSTVGFCAAVLQAAGMHPTVLIGADLSEEDGGFLAGDGEILLLEACEYKEAFLSLAPTHALALNVDFEHPDFYKSEAAVKKAFESYLRLPTVKKAIARKDICAMAESFGEQGGMHAEDVSLSLGRARFTLCRGQERLGAVSLSVLGEYQVENAVAAAALCSALGVEDGVILDGLSDYSGISGRMELKGYVGEAPVYLDYAHHPVELSAALSFAASLGKKVLCLFEAHTYSRVRAFEKEYTRLLRPAYRTGVLPIFPARERDTLGMSGARMAADAGADYIPDYNSAAKYILEYADNDTAVFIIGAGTVGRTLSFLEKDPRFTSGHA